MFGTHSYYTEDIDKQCGVSDNETFEVYSLYFDAVYYDSIRTKLG